MILADENLHPRLIQALRLAQIDVFSIKEHHRGISDEEIIALSRNPPRIILTEDKDFGEWVFAHQEKFISVILLRYVRAELEEIIQMILALINEKGGSLYGKFITVSVNKIRIREL